MYKFIALFAVLAVFLSVTQPAFADKAWKASASTIEDKFEPQLAIDGDLSTRWSSQFADNQWWKVDFGSPVKIKKITIIWEDAYAVEYRILYSADGKQWQQVFENTQG